MAAGFFFYDLETSGFDPKHARIMQFAGQRTDDALNPVGEPVNILIRLTADTLPDPDAIMVTGITPQATLADGITEAEFLRYFYEHVVKPDTIFLGYNSVRFDDEFMRYLHYRNYYDAYRWHWCDGCSRWDILDVVRMTRALRPDGIVWPFSPDGKPSNRLELLTKVNKIDHFAAHDALSDVSATIAVTKLIRDKQPKLFQYLLDMRDKRKVAALVQSGEPFAYSSGTYPSEHEKTTAVVKVADLPNGQGALVYNLRFDPAPLAAMTAEQLADRWRWRKDRPADQPPLPVKAVKFNKCPAVAPLSVVDIGSQKRIGLDLAATQRHMQALRNLPEFGARLLAAMEILDKERPQMALLANEQAVDGQLYDGFLDERDHDMMGVVRASDAREIGTLSPHFHDQRLSGLWPLYKARNYPALLSSEERAAWDTFCAHRLLDGGSGSRMAKFFARLQALAASPGVPASKQYILQELQLYAESIVPSDASEA
ncbi:MAG TPA: exodeoxyribonuclease I [Candidatus Saccharimonadales bacterium]|nr:exodeoxyribonuclease I [Candidatus Saccharimonadales bacterium]